MSDCNECKYQGVKSQLLIYDKSDPAIQSPTWSCISSGEKYPDRHAYVSLTYDAHENTPKSFLLKTEGLDHGNSKN